MRRKSPAGTVTAGREDDQASKANREAGHEVEKRRFVELHVADKVAVALCHGTDIFSFAQLPNGEYLFKAKTVTGFANVEADFADKAVWNRNLLPRDRFVMPWRFEDALPARGANFIQAGLWRAFAVRDGTLVAGQQNFSSAETARQVIETLGRRSTKGTP